MRMPFIEAATAALVLIGASSARADAGPVATAPPAAADAASPAPAAPPAAPPPALHAPKGVGDCVWGEVPLSVRDAIGQAQSIGEVADAIKQLSGSREDRIALAKHCNAPADVDPVDLVGQVVESRTLEIWTAAQLGAAYAVRADALDAAWADATADDRARLAAWCAAGFDGSDAPDDALARLGGKLGLAGGDALSLLGFYAGGRALFEQLGGTG